MSLPPHSSKAPSNDIAALFVRINNCMIRDQHRLRRQLRRANNPIALSKLADRINTSAALRQTRQANLPVPTFPPDLPIAQQRDAIAAAIASNQVVVICGQTGSGKTTQLPKICLSLGRGAAGLIGHTQPRRIAARSVATRIAEELRSPLGQHVGYKVRFTDDTSAFTSIKLMTDGILLAETQHDPYLSAYDTLIIDEAHERSLNIDFLLGYLHQLLPKRPDLKLIITSATIDPKRFADHFATAVLPTNPPNLVARASRPCPPQSSSFSSDSSPVPIIEVSGRTYPVEVRYRPPTDPHTQEPLDQTDAIVGGVHELCALGQGDILVFLPGERDIRDAADALRDANFSSTEILPLYARLTAAQQMQVFKPSKAHRRIVLATNVAETSLTVPGIKYVIDTGLARVARYASRTGVQRLPIEPISQASANQRAGRCGRVSDGVCIRLYSQDDFDSRDEFTSPEILRSDLSSVILQMAALKLSNIESFPFVEPPRPAMIRDGLKTLHELGALDDYNQLTDLGRQLARLPVDPRIARMILAAHDEHCLHETLIIAAALSIQDPRERPIDQADAADQAHVQFEDLTSDFLTYLNLWNFYRAQQRKLSSSKLRKLCKQNFLSSLRMREWLDVHRQLIELTREAGLRTNVPDDNAPIPADAIHRSILTGLLSNIARTKPTDKGHSYEGASTKQLYIFPGSVLFSAKPKWIMAGEIVETTRVYARTVAKIDPAWLESLAAHLLKRTYAEPRWSRQAGRVLAEETVTLFGLPIVERRTIHFGPIDPTQSRQLFIHHALIENDLKTNAPFAKHNRALIKKIRALESRRRTRDLLADQQTLYDFFDRQLPDNVYSSDTLNRWLKQVTKDNPRALHLSESDLLQRTPDADTDTLYPKTLTTAGHIFKLSYRFEPGHPSDGITLTVPVQLLSSLTQSRLDWLVPGLIQEKAAELIKSLPKDLRTRFVPAPDFAARALARMTYAKGDFLAELSSALGSITGTTILSSDWNESALPDHLRMNIRVIDQDANLLATSRSLPDLRTQLASRIGVALGIIHAPDFDTSDLTDWPPAHLDIPAKLTFTRDAITVTGHPAFLDDGPHVNLRVLESRPLARRMHRAGLRRLYYFATKKELAHLLDHTPGIDQLRLLFAPLGPASLLNEHLSLAICDRAFLTHNPDVRAHADFTAHLDHNWPTLAAHANAAVDHARQLFSLHQHILTDLDNPPTPYPRSPHTTAAIADARDQLAHLVTPSVLTTTPPNWLPHLPRYLQAIRDRLDALRTSGQAGPEKDAERSTYILPFWNAWKQKSQKHRLEGVFDPETETFRWMIEEFRVSQHAQKRGTSQPVSVERLQKQWKKTLV